MGCRWPTYPDKNMPKKSRSANSFTDKAIVAFSYLFMAKASRDLIGFLCHHKRSGLFIQEMFDALEITNPG